MEKAQRRYDSSS